MIKKCKSFDAFIVYIHSHGIKNTILCKNSYERNEQNESVFRRVIHFDKIIELFKDENCENLKNKPKLIFLNFCRN